MSICATKYIIINHGFMGSNTENWFPYVKEKIVIYGSDDPYIPQETFHNFATHLGAEEVIITNGGHLNTAAGFNEFSKVLTYL